jgi:hypothetical protein
MERQHQQVDELLTDGRTDFIGHGVEALRNVMQHVDEQTSGAIGRVELERAEPVGRTYATGKCGSTNLDHPQVGSCNMGKFVRLIRAFNDETARRATHVLAALGEVDLGARRHGDQEVFGGLVGEVARHPAVHGAFRGEPRQRDVSQTPVDQFSVEPVTLGKLDIERKIGFGNGLVPVPTAAGRGHALGCDDTFHWQHTPLAGSLGCLSAACNAVNAECTTRQTPVHSVSRPAGQHCHTLLSAVVHQRTCMVMEANA